MGEGRRETAQKVPATVERFLKQLVITFKAVALYPPQSSIPRENAADAVGLLRAELESRPDAILQVTKEGLVYQGAVVFPGQSAYSSFARDMYNHRLAEVRFHAGTDVRDILGFLEIVQLDPVDVAESGGFAAGLWERQVDAITVTEASIRVFDGAGPDEEFVPGSESWPPDARRIEELLLGAYARRGRDHVMLERVLSDARSVGVFLAESAAKAQRPAAEVASRLESLAHAVEQSPEERRAAMYRAIAEGFLGLEPEVRSEVVRTRMLPDARNDEHVAQVLRHMSLDQVAHILVEGFSAGEATQEGLSRAIRNLAQICLVGRDEVVNSIGAAMRSRGMSEDRIDEVLGSVSPQKLRVRERPRQTGERPIESIVRLVDIAPAQKLTEPEGDSAIEELRREAHRGFTDGDVLIALVGLVSLDPRPEAFASLMSIVEDGVGVLLERGEFEVAAQIAELLTATREDESLSAEQRNRMMEAVRTMATPEQMRILNHAFRVYPEGTSEHDACARLLDVLGGYVLQPMLEVLAAEQDMAARKSMVDLMSTMATGHIEELGGRVSDPRWYFVRNVVGILGKTRSPSILPHLERTLRHPDARVRRETVRALAGVKLASAEQMLATVLSDEDAQNVILAARYLGLNGARRSVGVLVEVARGEGTGNRDVGARVEAIEALGRIGDASAVSALEALAGKRSMLRGRAREVRAAAAAALAVLRENASAAGGGA